MTNLKERLAGLGYHDCDPSKTVGNRGNFGNRSKINSLGVPNGSQAEKALGTANPLKTLQFPKFPKFPTEKQAHETAESASLPWWRDPDAIEVRRLEIAGWLEFDEGLTRADADRRATALVAIEIDALAAIEVTP